MRTIGQMMVDVDRAFRAGPPRYGSMIQDLLNEIHDEMFSRLNRIEQMCNDPNPSKACWNVLKYIKSVRSGLGETDNEQ